MIVMDKEKVCSARQRKADRTEKPLNPSIPQPDESMLAIEIEPMPMRDPLGIDSFIGSVRSFRARLKARGIFLAVGIIA
jgi:hypothetical protein